jgi:hypothetical protein
MTTPAVLESGKPRRPKTIKRRLQVLILLTSSIALPRAWRFLAIEYWEVKTRGAQDLSTLAEVLGENTSAAMTFEDR